MPKVTSTTSIDFPKYNWGINAWAVRELPEDKEAQKDILACPYISELNKLPVKKNNHG